MHQPPGDYMCIADTSLYAFSCQSQVTFISLRFYDISMMTRNSGSRKSSRQKRPVNAALPGDLEPEAKRSTVLGRRPKIVVGLDFGTTYSGFAYSHASDMSKVMCFYDWPHQAAAGAKPYCKTETSLRYVADNQRADYRVEDWGWRATVNHKIALQKSRSSGQKLEPQSYLVKKFKLHLATSKNNRGALTTSTRRLPVELTAERTISDYLRMLLSFVMNELQNKYGMSTSKKDVQWCLTVPAMWDDFAKQQMVKCAEMAGMVQGPSCPDPNASPYQIITVLEPEAASVYCQTKLKDIHFDKGSKFLVVDAGGGTVDLVVHQKVEASGVKVREVACSTGSLCGGIFVDKNFHILLASKFGCYEKFQEDYPASFSRIQEYVEDLKCCYNGEANSYSDCMDIPAKLATAWEAHDKNNGTWNKFQSYDELRITEEDMRKIFDEVVDQILELIRDQFCAVGDLQAIMVVGGFSNSPYLMRRIRDEFSAKVKHILCPAEPGSAVCRGAVAFGAVDAEVMLSRKSRKTYGIRMSRPFRVGDPPEFSHEENGQSYCRNVFSIFIRKGADVPVDHQVKHEYEVPRGLKLIEVEIHATDDSEPGFVTEPGVEAIGSWTYNLSPQAQRMDVLPSLQIGMFFGRSKIEIQVVPVNFKSKEKSMTVNFERDLC